MGHHGGFAYILVPDLPSVPSDTFEAKPLLETGAADIGNIRPNRSFAAPIDAALNSNGVASFVRARDQIAASEDDMPLSTETDAVNNDPSTAESTKVDKLSFTGN